MIDGGKRNILGVLVDAVDYDAALERIVAAAKARSPLAVSALAVHGVMTGVLDPSHRYRLNHFDLIVPDGQPVRWALNWLHRAKLPHRVYGPTLMLKTCQRAADEGLSVFLYGGTSELLAALRANLERMFPSLQIAGTEPSQFRRVTVAETGEIVEKILASDASITFVGLGCPRQEVFAFELRHALCMPLLAVGAAFNFHAGELAQAPSYLQARGLEWLYRLLHEPRRLWRRYLLLNPLYLTLLALQVVQPQRFDPLSAVPPCEELRYG